MNYTRIFSDGDLSFGNKFNLSMEASKHLSKVLRKKDGNLIRVFDGRGYSCLAEVTKKTKKILIYIPLKQLLLLCAILFFLMIENLTYSIH